MKDRAGPRRTPVSSGRRENPARSEEHEKHLSPDDDAPSHAPRSVPDVFFNHHVLMMSFIAGRFIVGMCEK